MSVMRNFILLILLLFVFLVFEEAKFDKNTYGKSGQIGKYISGEKV